MEIIGEFVMKIKIGIDTGGTYTDAVALCYDTQNVLCEAKARTTRENLAVGIAEAIDKLQISEPANVSSVCLSTTLTTNAIVEGMKSSVGLITIGAVDQKKFPVAYHAEVGGKIGIDGCEVNPLNKQEIDRALKKIKGQVNALAISGYASVRNPIHEIEIKKEATEILGVPIVCAHELTSALGYYERTVTAALNANLIPIIKELITATKTILTDRNIDAQILFFKGDGHVITDSFVQERPVETILSGPAASMVGGRFLADGDHAIIADMGGTTTDVVVIIDGVIPHDKKGALVGGWQTKVNSVQMNTFGLGGDSYIRSDSSRCFDFGPERVVPLCVAAQENRVLLDELKSIREKKKIPLANHQEVDCYRIFKKENIDKAEFHKQEMQIVKLLENGSHSIFYLASQLGKDADNLNMGRLLDKEIVQKISMTPTDLLHVTGEYREWNSDASILGADLFARRLNTSFRDFVVQAEKQFVYRICLALLQSLCRVDGVDFDPGCDEKAKYFIDNALGENKRRTFDISLKCSLPIIGLGRPSKSWFSKVAKLLGTRLIIPEYSHIGSAVGAAVGGAREILDALIRFNPQAKKFVVHTPKNRRLFNSCEEAKQFAKQELSGCAETLAKSMNIEGWEILIQERDDFFSCSTNRDTDQFVETHMTAVISASGCGLGSN